MGSSDSWRNMPPRWDNLDAVLTLDLYFLSEIVENSEKTPPLYFSRLPGTMAHFTAVGDLIQNRNLDSINKITGLKPKQYQHLLPDPTGKTTLKNVSASYESLSKLKISGTSLGRSELELPLELLGEWATQSLQYKSRRIPPSRLF